MRFRLPEALINKMFELNSNILLRGHGDRDRGIKTLKKETPMWFNKTVADIRYMGVAYIESYVGEPIPREAKVMLIKALTEDCDVDRIEDIAKSVHIQCRKEANYDA